MNSSIHKTAAALALSLAAAPFAAGQTAYFTQSGTGNNGNPQAWGGTNNTSQSVAFELTFDFTSAVDNETAPIDLWEAGATGNGAALVLRGDELYFFAGNSNDDVVIGNHGLTAGQTGVQVVSVYDINAGAGGNEVLSIYVNGNPITSGEADTANAWAGSDAGFVGGNSGNTRYVSYSVFGLGDTVPYPTQDIDFAVYQLASSGGNANNTLENILVPEPSSLALISLGGLLLIRRRSSQVARRRRY